MDTTTPQWYVSQLDGNEAPSLESLQGKVVLILFYSIGCPGCKSRAIPIAKNVHEIYPDVQVVGIHTSLDERKYSTGQIEEINKVHRIPFPIYVDEGSQTFEAFGAEGTPHWILIDAEGKVLRSVFGSMPNAINRIEYSLIELFPDQIEE
jgi:peroxiredoxin